MKKTRSFFLLVSFVLVCVAVVGALGYQTLMSKNQKTHAYGYTPPVSHIVGYIDAVDGNQVSGWACNEGASGAALVVVAQGSDGTFFGTRSGTELRTDVTEAGHCNGNSAVGFTIPYICDPLIAHDQEIHVIAHDYGLLSSSELPRSSPEVPTSVTIQPCNNGVR